MGTKESNWRSKWKARREARRQSRADLNGWKSSGKNGADADRLLATWTQGERNAHWARSPRERSEEVTNELDHRRGVTREVVLKGLLGAGGLIYLAGKGVKWLDQETLEQRENALPDKPTHMDVLADCKAWFPPKDGKPLPNESFITIGGLGCVSSEPHAKPMGDKGLGLPNNESVPMSFLVASIKGKTVEEVAALLKEEKKKGKSLSFYGHSNGAVVVLEALHYLKETEHITIPINRFILNCSPFDFGDAKDNFIEEMLGKFLAKTGYKPGEVLQFLYQMWQNWAHGGEAIFERFINSVETAWEKTRNGEPPGAWTSDLRILVGSRLNEHDFTGIITPETKWLYLQSQSDSVVHNGQSIDKYRTLAAKYGPKENFEVEAMAPGIRHGDSDKGSEYANPWLRRSQLGLAA